MGAGHDHSNADTRVSRMVIAAAILTAFFVLELTTAVAINSLALLSDAGHMLTDLVAMFMGLTAVLLARRGSASPARTYGWHRAEVFTAVANAVLLLGVAAFILYEAVDRLGDQDRYRRLHLPAGQLHDHQDAEGRDLQPRRQHRNGSPLFHVCPGDRSRHRGRQRRFL